MPVRLQSIQECSPPRNFWRYLLVTRRASPARNRHKSTTKYIQIPRQMDMELQQANPPHSRNLLNRDQTTQPIMRTRPSATSTPPSIQQERTTGPAPAPTSTNRRRPVSKVPFLDFLHHRLFSSNFSLLLATLVVIFSCGDVLVLKMEDGFRTGMDSLAQRYVDSLGTVGGARAELAAGGATVAAEEAEQPRPPRVDWGGNRLAYPHRTGSRPVSDQCPVGCTVHAQSMSQSMHSPPCRLCHMSDLRSHVGSAECPVGSAECHFIGCTGVLTEIHESSLKVVRCW